MFGSERHPGVNAVGRPTSKSVENTRQTGFGEPAQPACDIGAALPRKRHIFVIELLSVCHLTLRSRGAAIPKAPRPENMGIL